jgi:hypothetical protein
LAPLPDLPCTAESSTRERACGSGSVELLLKRSRSLISASILRRISECFALLQKIQAHYSADFMVEFLFRVYFAPPELILNKM